jgi:hypothetical protein
MNLEFGLTSELTNTRYAPLAALCALYQSDKWLEPLRQVQIPMRQRDFTHFDKLFQVLLTILAGCQTLAEANPRLKQERLLAAVCSWSHFADQLEQLRTSIQQIWRARSQIWQRDWRGFLWLDFDLTGLPCGPQAELSQKGYFSDKKRTRTAAGAGQCGRLPRKPVVGSVSRQLPHRAMFPTRRVSQRNCFRLIRDPAQTHGLAHGWRGGQ